MDPNHFHYQQAFFNYMQNYQNLNPQNSQISSVPNNPNMFPRPQMNSNSMELSTQVPPFSTQVGTEKEERVVIKKNLESKLQGMRIYTTYPIMAQCFKGSNYGA
ncbi:unnamed protein product [Lathyrus sativus]|nr:unnamed protein product [Lathyrus sativus]